MGLVEPVPQGRSIEIKNGREAADDAAQVPPGVCNAHGDDFRLFPRRG